MSKANALVNKEKADLLNLAATAHGNLELVQRALREHVLENNGEFRDVLERLNTAHDKIFSEIITFKREGLPTHKAALVFQQQYLQVIEALRQIPEEKRDDILGEKTDNLAAIHDAFHAIGSIYEYTKPTRQL